MSLESITPSRDLVVGDVPQEVATSRFTSLDISETIFIGDD